MNYTEGKVLCAFSTTVSTTVRTMVNGYAQKHNKERELNITFKLLNQCEE
jgi:hypothetical protein